MVCYRIATTARGDDGQRRPKVETQAGIQTETRAGLGSGPCAGSAESLASGQLPFVAKRLGRFCLRFVRDDFPGVALLEQRAGELVVQAVA